MSTRHMRVSLAIGTALVLAAIALALGVRWAGNAKAAAPVARESSRGATKYASSSGSDLRGFKLVARRKWLGRWAGMGINGDNVKAGGKQLPGTAFSTAAVAQNAAGFSFRLPSSPNIKPIDGYVCPWNGRNVVEIDYEASTTLLVDSKGDAPAFTPPTFVTPSQNGTVAEQVWAPFADGRKTPWSVIDVHGHKAVAVEAGTQVVDGGYVDVPALLTWQDGTYLYQLRTKRAYLSDLRSMADLMYP